MDKDKLRDQKQAERMADSILAAEEILALKLRYLNTTDRTYTFECEGQTVTATYDTATLGVRPPNLYRIRLLAPPETVINGHSIIIDRHGRKQKAGATTEKGEEENHIIVETLAAKL